MPLRNSPLRKPLLAALMLACLPAPARAASAAAVQAGPLDVTPLAAYAVVTRTNDGSAGHVTASLRLRLHNGGKDAVRLALQGASVGLIDSDGTNLIPHPEGHENGEVAGGGLFVIHGDAAHIKEEAVAAATSMTALQAGQSVTVQIFAGRGVSLQGGTPSFAPATASLSATLVLAGKDGPDLVGFSLDDMPLKVTGFHIGKP